MEQLKLSLKQFFKEDDYNKFESLIEDLKTYEDYENLLNIGAKICEIILPLKLDVQTYSACVLLPFEKRYLTEIKENEKLSQYQESILLAESVIKISKFSYDNEQVELEALRAMLIAIAKDIRVMIIKLAEIVYFARRTRELDEQTATFLHREIKDVYSPIASRLGLSFIKSELNDLNLSFYKPNEYKKLLKQVAEDSRNGGKRIENVIAKINDIMSQLGIKGYCYGRVKHISSIYNKLQEKNKTLSQIYDLCAIRVIVNSTNDCYAILSAIHTEFIALDGRFKDYIARPKSNGYQSLHTVVLIDDEPLELQIRTFEMHTHAEYGIAAHFLYKEHKNKLGNLDDKLLWIRKILESNDAENANDLIECLKTDVYSGEIFVQTPLGKIIQLTELSTPIDFAYAIHSHVGNKCVGARVNGKMVPLSSTLSNGDVVEIITNQNAKGPSRDWLSICKTSAAKNRIKQFFRQEMKEENIKKGKAILELASKNKGYNLKELMDKKIVETTLEKYAFNTEDEMFAAVGYGSITSTQILNKLVDLYLKSKPQHLEIIKTIQKQGTDKTNIDGLGGILVKYAKCCSPIPGDDIVGFVSRGSGVTIHRKDCVALKSLEQDRLMPISWGNNNSTENYVASLKLYVENSTGVLATISTKVAENKINITKISSSIKSQEEAIIDLSFLVKSKQELDDFINKLNSLSIVHSVVRSGN